jgi:hypothetical protein
VTDWQPISVERIACSFCGQTRNKVGELFSGDDAWICAGCVRRLSERIEGLARWRAGIRSGEAAQLKVLETEHASETRTVRVSVPRSVEGRLTELWDTFRRRGNLEARTELMRYYAPLVGHVVDHVTIDQFGLLGTGTSGLATAIETYQPGSGESFESYAVRRIKWAVLEELEGLARDP